MDPSIPTKPATPKKVGFLDILFAPIGCLIQIPPILMFGGILVAFLVGSYLYNYVNVSLFGIGTPPYDKLVIKNAYQDIQLPDYYSWTIEFEKIPESKFIGKVRFVGPIRLSNFVILTHDILVTSGDFADESKIVTSVSNHKFTWMTRLPEPKGKINLIHAVPANEKIYQQLMTIRNDMQVDIRGREIYRLNAFDDSGEAHGWWEDSGCNTMLITSITFITADDEE